MTITLDEMKNYLRVDYNDDDELIENMQQGYDVVQLSAMMNTNINLMLIKLHELNRMGWRLNLPYVPRSDFLRNVKPEG